MTAYRMTRRRRARRALRNYLAAHPCDLSRPGHFCAAHHCRWWRHDHVGRYCVSSVGEYYPPSAGGSIDEVGHGRLYETMVFDRARRGGRRWSEVTMRGAKMYEAAECIHTATVKLVRMGYLPRMVQL